MGMYVHNKQDIPKGQHYVILDFGTITVPGDERSRTNPGHGYPEYTQYTVDYIVFESKKAWEDEIKRRTSYTYGSKNFAAMICIPAKIETQITVNVTTESESTP